MDKIAIDPMGPGALRRGLHIVNLLRRQGGTLSVAAIAKATGLPRPTAYRLLDVLESEGYVRRDDTGKRFALGSPDVSLGDHWQMFVQDMKPVMISIARRTGNAVFLVRRDELNLLCLHREIGPYPIQVLSLNIGGRQPLGVGAAGVAMLSTLAPRQLASLLKRNQAAYLDYGNLQLATVRRLVENCLARGYAVVGGYSLKGVLAVGVAIPATASLPLAALSVTAPLDRMPLARQREIAQIIQDELKPVIG
ncbi:IclR family transcriptional regulator [Bordetella sp. BOR01]|uniref:IclR family transcriptional regulator n=1 Tax=Bordetella sp. BOR01 TaxID=2854779 RepID=UPI001C467976|nr:IclR family transcriptional regulator [Bordetella sp. BOR01]MBV7486050.1 IclR family transcriptional regulator [Bordetella sp. BOR01]